MWFNRDVDDAIVRPLPRIKRLLSEQTYLPHIVQLLLTFDPVLVEKVSTLLYHMMQDNPMLSRSEYLLCIKYLPKLSCFSIRMLFTTCNLIINHPIWYVCFISDSCAFNCRLYLSGVFFFIMMYTGSNVLPLARFLKYTHLKQALRLVTRISVSDRHFG